MTIIGAISGAHSTGKTSTIRKIIPLLESEGFTVETIKLPGGRTDSPERESLEHGFSLDKNVNYDSEQHILHSTIKYDLEARQRAKLKARPDTKVGEPITVSEADFILYDRCVLDVIPYTMYADTISYAQKERIRKQAVRHLMEYPIDIIFRPELLGTIENDGVRPLEIDYQVRIDKFFDAVYRDLPEIMNRCMEPTEAEGMFFMPKVVKLPKYTDDSRVSKALRIIDIQKELFAIMEERRVGLIRHIG